MPPSTASHAYGCPGPGVQLVRQCAIPIGAPLRGTLETVSASVDPMRLSLKGAANSHTLHHRLRHRPARTPEQIPTSVHRGSRGSRYAPLSSSTSATVYPARTRRVHGSRTT